MHFNSSIRPSVLLSARLLRAEAWNSMESHCIKFKFGASGFHRMRHGSVLSLIRNARPVVRETGLCPQPRLKVRPFDRL